MQHKVFMGLVEEQATHCLDVLEKKGKLYAKGKSRLEHFIKTAAWRSRPTEAVIMDLGSKHFTLLNEMCEKPKDYSEEQWIETMTDAINYLLILAATRRGQV